MMIPLFLNKEGVFFFIERNGVNWFAIMLIPSNSMKNHYPTHLISKWGKF